MINPICQYVANKDLILSAMLLGQAKFFKILDHIQRQHHRNANKRIGIIERFIQQFNFTVLNLLHDIQPTSLKVLLCVRRLETDSGSLTLHAAQLQLQKQVGHV